MMFCLLLIQKVELHWWIDQLCEEEWHQNKRLTPLLSATWSIKAPEKAALEEMIRTLGRDGRGDEQELLGLSMVGGLAVRSTVLLVRFGSLEIHR